MPKDYKVDPKTGLIITYPFDVPGPEPTYNPYDDPAFYEGLDIQRRGGLIEREIRGEPTMNEMEAAETSIMDRLRGSDVPATEDVRAQLEAANDYIKQLEAARANQSQEDDLVLPPVSTVPRKKGLKLPKGPNVGKPSGKSRR